MKYWFDTEFNEHDGIIELISIGIISEDGREYYAENSEFCADDVDPWIIENVVSQLTGQSKTKNEIKQDLTNFFNPAPTEIWAWFGEYDWIVLRQIFGHMLEWPSDWPLSHMNLEQLRISKNTDNLPPQPKNSHHALADAKWCKEAWTDLIKLS